MEVGRKESGHVCVGMAGPQCIVMEQQNHGDQTDGGDETGCGRHRGKKRK